jgi:hypothetical protein
VLGKQHRHAMSIVAQILKKGVVCIFIFGL